MAKWLVRNKKGDIERMSSTLDISQTLSQVLINRGIYTKDSVNKFLNPSMDHLHNSDEMKDMTKGIKLLKSSISKKEKIAIYGDYDVDGIMSTAILYKGIKSIYGDVIYYIPNRKKEGYGLNMEAVKKLKQDKVDLIITCDNGIAALEEIKYAKSLGMKVIIIDHHEAPYITYNDDERVETLPEADAIIDPKQKFCNYKFKHLCAAALCYKFINAYFDYERDRLLIKNELLIFAAIATFCDIVDLQDENRVIASQGLKLMNARIENVGLRELFREKDCKKGLVDEFIIGYTIGPCINATGRLKHADLAMELFLTQDIEEAAELARKISQLNERRKLMTKEAVDGIIDSVAVSETAQQESVLVIYDRNIHESIAGIVAGRLKDKLRRPIIVITQGENMSKGSARSVDGYNIFEELNKCKHLLERFGGHEMAAGFSMLDENVEKLKEELNRNSNFVQKEFEETIILEKAMLLQDVTYLLAKEMNKLKPFGKSNKEPFFGSKMVRVESLRTIEAKDTVIFNFLVGNTSSKIKGICFGELDKLKNMINKHFNEQDSKKILYGEKLLAGNASNTILNMDIVYSANINTYNSEVSVQLRIKDFRISKPVGDK